MKKSFILFLLLITASCTIEPTFSGAVDPTVLDPVSGLIFERSRDISYIFFSKEQYVLIENKNSSVNSYYKLLKGEVFRDNVVTYQLEGWGGYNNQFIGLYIETEKNPQITEEKPFPDTKLGITLQNSRSLAINATKNLGSSSSSRDVTLGKKLQSPALYTLKALSPVVQTSAAGIFKPEENTFLSIKDLTPEGNTHATLVKSTNNNEDGSLTSQNFALTFESPETLSDSAAIYQYNTNGVQYLIGIKFDLNFNSEFPRLQIIERVVPTGQLINAVANLEFELDNITVWEYGFFSFLRVLDNSLDLFKDILFVEYITGLTQRYNPLETSRWLINSSEDSIRISVTTNNTYTEEDYLIGPTSKPGVFELIDFRNNNEAQTYSGKFFTMTSEGDVNAAQNIVTTLISDTLEGFNQLKITNKLKRITDLTVHHLELVNKTELNTPTLGEFSENKPIAGRSGFQAYVESDTDTIHLVGGYTSRGAFTSGVPRIWERNSPSLQKVYNNIWSIKGITEGNPIYEDTGLKLLNGNNPAFQQIIGATTKKTLANPNDHFWAYGAGADSFERTSVNADKFSSKNSANREWDTFSLNTSSFIGKYNSAMVAHNNSLYILGGLFSATALANGADGATEQYGEFRNEIYITPTLSAVTSSTWRELRKSDPNDLKMWSPRVHSRVFSIGKTMILVGGFELNNETVSVPKPINDVWISEDNGTNWNIKNSGGPIVTTEGISGPPPIQKTINDGPLIGTVHGGIIYLLDPSTRNVYYSPNKGTDWFKTSVGFETNSIPLYGAQLVAIKNQLILIGGQTKALEEPDFNNITDMESKIYKIHIASGV